MKHVLSIDHIGYAVHDIQETAAPYLAAGWALSEVYNEEVQHAKIAFLGRKTCQLSNWCLRYRVNLRLISS